ncbi:hypothetical protein B296_00019949 [Ensete ventricosum]|uniref:Uncharacterized protein n=1 Tax=Ensete ventricosum TaxID=4639 RepID=A0A427B1Y9_ENSVE|nr:hypothetical protein B296_00019949 [Ensete ventricosum]
MSSGPMSDRRLHRHLGENHVGPDDQVGGNISILGGGVRTLCHLTHPLRAINIVWCTTSSSHTTVPTSSSYDSTTPKVTTGVRPNNTSGLLRLICRLSIPCTDRLWQNHVEDFLIKFGSELFDVAMLWKLKAPEEATPLTVSYSSLSSNR